ARDQLDPVTLGRKQLRETGRDVVALGVEHDDALARRQLPLDHHLLWRQHVGLRRVGAVDRAVRHAVHPVSGPGRPRRQDDDLGAVLAYARWVESGARDHLDVAELLELDAPPVDDPRPLAESGKLRDPAHDPAQVTGRLDEVDAAEASLAEHDRALHPGGTGADDEHVTVGVCRLLELLRMPPAPVLLARGRVLRAPEMVAGLALRDADIAADA